MIRLKKGPQPALLSQHQEVKTAEYIAAPKNKKPSFWRSESIVEAVKNECMRKCIYCEGLIDDVSYSAVEHIRPKSKFEHLVLEWSNLGLVCVRCNTNKGVYWTDTPELMLLNPFDDPIEDHIEFHGPMTAAKLSSSRGQNTLRQLRFSTRTDLLMSRLKRIEELDVILRIWHKAESSELKALFAEDVEKAIASDQEFSGVLRAYALKSGFVVTVTKELTAPQHP